VLGEARDILEPLGDRYQEAHLLARIGSTYSRLGELQRALVLLGDALKLQREAGDRPWEIASLNHLGSVWRRLGNPGKALDHHRRALELATALKDAPQEAITRLDIAQSQLDRGDPSAALRELDPALASLHEMGFRQDEAKALGLRGRALALAGRPREAVPVLLEALALRRTLRDRAGEAGALHELAATERSLGLREAARAQALQVLPFGALPVPDLDKAWDGPGVRKPLLERLEVVYLPSATTLTLQRRRLEHRKPAPKWAAILADPVFAPDDPRLGGLSVAGRLAMKNDPQRAGKAPGLLPVFERLPATRREAETIAGLAPPGQVWTAFDFQASREAVLSGELRAYRVIHFATHGVADTRNPELSGLVLSLVDAAGRPRQGFLGLADIYDLDLEADLVVLSGCRTALGKEVRGEGLMGLTRGFLYAGVPRVVASLWQVQDRTTAELMARFYEAMWRDGLSPAAALREAQRSLRRDPRYRAPYSWAGFVLQGDWR